MSTGKLNDGNRRPGTRPLGGTGSLRPPAPPPPPPPVHAHPPAGRPAPPAGDADGVGRRRLSTEDLPDVDLDGVQAPSREQRQAAAAGFDLSELIGGLAAQGQALNAQAHAREGQALNRGADAVGSFFGSVLGAVGLAETGQAVAGALDAVGDAAEVGTNLVGMLENAVGGLVVGAVAGAVDVVEDGPGALIAAANRVADLAGDVADAGGAIVGGGLDAAARQATAGGGVLAQASAFFQGAGSEAYDQLVVPAMEALAGPVVAGPDGTPTFASDVGDLAPLTQRINTGETVSLFGEAGVTVPTPVPALGVTLDAGGRVSLARVQTAAGRTELQLRITGHGQAGVELNASGSRARAGAGDTALAATAGYEANASAAVRGEVSATFSFDPTNAQDMATLAGMMQGFGGAAAGQLVAPGPLGAVVGGLATGGPAAREAMARAPRHLTELDGALGVQVSATLGLSAGAGLQRREGARELNLAQNAALERAQGTLAALNASVAGQATVGRTQNLRTGETTTYLALSGKAEAAGSLLAATAGTGAAGNVRLAIITDRSGASRVQVVRELSRADFQGIRTSIENAAGRPIRPGMAALIGESDTVRVTADLHPDVARRILAGDGAAIREALNLGGGAYSVAPDGVVAVHTETRSFSLAGQVSTVGARVRVGSENQQETTLLR